MHSILLLPGFAKSAWEASWTGSTDLCFQARLFSAFLVLDHTHLLAGRIWVGINWSSGEGVLIVFKYSLPVSWLSQKSMYVNLLTRGFSYVRIFFSVKIHTSKSCCSTKCLVGMFLFCSVFQRSICVVKACHYQNKSLSILFPVGTIWGTDLEMQTDISWRKLFHWEAWVFPSHPPNSLCQQFATIASLPQWDETQFIL